MFTCASYNIAGKKWSGWVYTSSKLNLHSSKPKLFFNFHSALLFCYELCFAGNHYKILQLSLLTGMHLLFPQNEFLNRSTFRSKFCKRKEPIFYLHMNSLFLNINWFKTLVREFMIEYTIYHRCEHPSNLFSSIPSWELKVIKYLLRTCDNKCGLYL
jgi:hypothetical protein